MAVAKPPTEIPEVPELDAYLNPSQTEEFTVDSLVKLDWVLRKAREVQVRLAEVNYAAEEEIRRIRQWATDSAAKLQPALDYFEAQAVTYLQTRQAQGDERKSIKVTNGKVWSRAQQPEFRRDEGALLPWLEKNEPEWVKNTPTADWAAVKAGCKVHGDKLVAPTGEIVPGVEVVDRDPVYGIEPV